MMLKKLAIFYMVYINNGWVTVNVCKTKIEKMDFWQLSLTLQQLHLGIITF